MPPGSYCSRTIYHGHVQGVGFRWTTERIARRHPVRGFVRNRPEGTVELVAAGDKTAVDAFLDEVAASMRKYIHEADTQPHSPPDDFQDFEIRH
jgi:acylphosphatase